MNRFRSTLLAAALMATTTGAFAHAHLKSSTPAKNASVAPATASVTLTFTEEVQTGMSVFRVYPVKDAAAADATAKSSLAGTDAAPRVDSGVTPAKGESSAVTVHLKAPLKAGTYLVVWKVMAADDGHVTHGQYTFQVK